jgi:hypothetical protein
VSGITSIATYVTVESHGAERCPSAEIQYYPKTRACASSGGGGAAESDPPSVPHTATGNLGRALPNYRAAPGLGPRPRGLAWLRNAPVAPAPRLPLPFLCPAPLACASAWSDGAQNSTGYGCIMLAASHNTTQRLALVNATCKLLISAMVNISALVAFSE